MSNIYTIILLMDSVSLCLYRPSSEPIALRNVLKCPTRHTLYIIRFGHFSSAAFITKNAKNCVCAFNPVGVATGTRSSAAANEKSVMIIIIKGTRHKQNSLSGNTLFNYMPTYTRSHKKSKKSTNSTIRHYMLPRSRPRVMHRK